MHTHLQTQTHTHTSIHHILNTKYKGKSEETLQHQDQGGWIYAVSHAYQLNVMEREMVKRKRMKMKVEYSEKIYYAHRLMDNNAYCVENMLFNIRHVCQFEWHGNRDATSPKKTEKKL